LTTVTITNTMSTGRKQKPHLSLPKWRFNWGMKEIGEKSNMGGGEGSYISSPRKGKGIMNFLKKRVKHRPNLGKKGVNGGEGYEREIYSN